MAYQYPYGDTQQLNLAWFLDEFKALQEAWEQEKQGITGALDAEIARAEAALSGVIEARDQAAASAADALTYRNAAQSASQAAELSKTNAETARRDASNYAVSAAGSAQNASNSAIAAGNSATLAESAKTTAIQQANAAVQASGAASGYAQTAGQEAANAAASATAADGSATDAAGSATTAGEEADRAEAAADEVADSVTQIATNTSDISDLKESISNIETEVAASFEQKTITDVPIASFDDGANGLPVKKLVIDIEPVQSGAGDPSPDNIRPITGWTIAKVTRTGKNIIQAYVVSSAINAYNNVIFIKTRMIKPDTTYTISFVGTPGNTIYANEALFTKATPIDLTGERQSITLRTRSTIEQTNDRQYNPNSGWIIFKNSKNQQNPNVFNNPQMEVGSEATDYQPIEPTFDITFPSEAGTVYVGTLDVTNGKLIVLYDSVDLGTLNYNRMASGRFYTASLKDLIARPASITSVFEAYSSEYTAGSYQGLWSKNGIMFAQADNGTIYLRNDAYDDATAFKTAMQEVKLIYRRKTPVEYDLTPTEVTTLLDTNNICADTGNINELIYRAMNNTSAQITLVKAIITPVLDSMIADTALVVNDFRIVNNTLYRVTAPISSGGTLTVGTNVVATTVADVLKSLLN